MKLTPWFPCNVTPVHSGVYQVRGALNSPWYRRWDGRQWYWGSERIKSAAKSETVFQFQGGALEWRGLATKPKGKK